MPHTPEGNVVEKVLIVGCGYAGRAIARALAGAGVFVTGTVARAQGLDAVAAAGATPHRLDLSDGLAPSGRSALTALVDAHDAVVYAVGPERVGEGERFTDHLPAFLNLLAEAPPRLAAFVYLSSTGVYGARDGAWVDEATPPGDDPGPRGRLRKAAEASLLAAWRDWGLPVRILRLAGIYGPGRHVGLRLRAGTCRVVEADPPLVVNRIHVDDLARAAVAALNRGVSGEVYVVADDRPATMREVADHAAALLGQPPPPGETLDQARERLGEANLHLVADRKRCRNRKLKEELGVWLAYPTYREGISAVLRADGLLAEGP